MKITHYLCIASAAIMQPVFTIGQQSAVPMGGNHEVKVDAAVKAKIDQWMQNNGGLRFMENKGQMTDMDHKPVKDLLFEVSGNGVDMYVTTGGLSYVFTQKQIYTKKDKSGQDKDSIAGEFSRADMELVGADIRKENIVKESRSGDYSNYYLGGITATNVYSYDRITIKNIYPGIDWVLYTASGANATEPVKAGLQYDFIIHPGADPSEIKLRYKWTDEPKIQDDGSMKVTMPLGCILEGKPVTHYMDGNGDIKTHYTYENDEVGFTLAGYDIYQPVFIDPVLNWNTYFGGTSGGQITKGAAIWSDVPTGGNHIFIGGTTTATAGFPVSNPGGGAYYKSTFSGTQDMFIAEFTTAGARVWVTYFGGTNTGETDFLEGISGDNNSPSIGSGSGNLWVTGNTNTGNSNFPATNPGGYNWLQTYNNIDWNGNGGFLGTYLGTSTGPPMSSGGFGYTVTTVCPVVMQFVKSTGALEYSTYFGGGTSGGDNSRAIWDDGTDVWITGYTATSKFPNMWQPGYYHAASGNPAPFIVEFAAVTNGSQNAGNLVWSTWIGTAAGTGNDICSDGTNVWMTGVSQGGLPVANPGGGAFYQGSLPGSYSAGFICQFNIANISNGSQPYWCTYYGGNGAEGQVGTTGTPLSTTMSDVGTNIYSNGTDFWMTGFTGSNNLASESPAAITNPGGSSYYVGTNTVGGIRPFIAEFNTSGVLQWGTYYGGTASGETSEPVGLSEDNNGNVWVTGYTNSGSFPTLAISTSSCGGYFKSSLPTGAVDEWIAQFDVNGGRHWSTYFGGTTTGESSGTGGGNATVGVGAGHDIYSDGTNVWMTGFTSSAATGFPITNPGGGAYYQSTITGTDAFIAQFQHFVYSTLSASPAFACTGSGITLTAGISGGTAPYSYTWASSNASTAPATTNISANSYTVSVSPPSAATYTLTVTDANGYCATSSVLANIVSSGLWTGIDGTSWNNPDNWCPMVVPTNTTTVIIPAGAPNYPASDTGATVETCASLSIASGASMTVPSGVSLIVYGNISNSGTLTNNNYIGVKNGNWTSPGTYTAGAGSINEFYGTTAQTVSNASGTTFSTIDINNTALVSLSGGAITTSTLTIGDTTAISLFGDGGNQITSTGTLNLDNSSTFFLGGSSATTFPLFASINIATGTTVNYTSSAAQNISGTPTYYNLTVSSASVKTLTGTTNVNNVLTIGTGATLAGSTFTINLNGSGTPFVTTGTFTANTSTVNYAGTSATNVAAVTYYNLNLTGGATYTLLGSTGVSDIATVNLGSTFNLGASDYTLSFTGTGTGFTPFLINGTFTPGTSIVSYNSASGTTNITSTTYDSLTVNGAGTFTFLGNTTCSGSYWQEGASTVYLNNALSLGAGDSTGHHFICGKNFALASTAGTTFYLQHSTADTGAVVTVANTTFLASTFAGVSVSLYMDAGPAKQRYPSIFNTANLYAGSTGSTNLINWGSSTVVKANKFNISGAFTKTGTSVFTTTGTVSNGGFYFNGNGTLQKLSYPTADGPSDKTSFTINQGALVQLQASMTLGTTTAATPVDSFAVYGTLDCETSLLLGAVAASNNYFTLENGGTLKSSDLSGISDAAIGSIDATANTITGTFKTGANYYLYGTGNYPANFPSGVTTMNNLTIADGTAADSIYLCTGVSTAGTFTVNGTVTLSTGYLGLGGSNLVMGASGTITNNSSTSPYTYIEANGAGTVTYPFGSASTTFLYPVGDNKVTAGGDYSPISVTVNSAAAFPDNISIRVSKAKEPNNKSTTNYLNRYWVLTQSGAGAINYNFTGTYVAGTYTAVTTVGDVTGTEANIYTGLIPGTFPGTLPWIQYNQVVTTPTHYISGSGVTSTGTCTGINGVASVTIAPSSGCQLTATTSGGTSPYTYSWSTGASGTSASVTNSISPATSGVYSVTVTDNNGVTATASLNYTILSTTASVTLNVLCYENSTGIATASPTGGTTPYTYSWSTTPSQNTISATGLSAGTYTVVVAGNLGCNTSASVTVTQPALLTANASQVSAASCGSSNGVATVAVAGGETPYTYSWNDGNSQMTATATGLSGGAYTVTVTDNFGCSVTSATSVGTSGGPSVSISGYTNVTCNGYNIGTATAAVTGGVIPYTYSWSDASSQTTPTATGLSPGVFYITVTDNTDCSNITSVTITQPTVLTITRAGVTNVQCNGGTGSATANMATGGTMPYTYSWNDGNSQTTLTATSLSAGTYTITATDNNGCTASASATITQPPSPLGITIASAPNVNCNGGKVNITANAATGGTSPYTYSWSPTGGTGLTASNQGAGTYTITATDNHQCTTNAVATITQPATPLGITIQTVINVQCHGGSGSITANAATGGTSPYTYSWTSSEGTNLSITAPAATYTITATDNNGCPASISATITQPGANLVAAINTVVNVSCNGGSNGSMTATIAGGTTPYTYIWTDPNSQSTQAATGLSAGTYTVLVFDAHDCSTQASNTITQPATGVAVSTSVTNVLCNGSSTGSATATASGGVSPYTYSWSSGEGTRTTATALSAGTYTVTATDHNGCPAMASVTITQPSTTVSVSIASVSSLSCSGANSGSATANPATGGNPPYTYSWSSGEGSNLAATGLSAGVYAITVYDNSGCNSAANATITQPLPMTVGVTEANVSCSQGTLTATVSGTVTQTFSYESSVQHFNVPPGITTVTVSIAGGEGGGTAGGAGASFLGICTVVPGDVLGVVVGKQGGATSTTYGAGGGGASWVYDSAEAIPSGTNHSGTPNLSALLAVAAGGGGESNTSMFAGISGGAAGGTNLSTTASGGSYAGGTNGSGGTSATSTTGVGGGGAGWISNGGSGTAAGNFGGGGGQYWGAASYFSGGSGSTEGNLGGYGGGGQGGSECGGGGGGYNGGGGGELLGGFTAEGGGGGGSYLSGTLLSAGAHTGNGTVTISYSGVAGTPPYTYSWTGGGGNSSTTIPLNSGSYTVTVTDASSCTATASGAITLPPALGVTISSVTNVLCNGGTGSATALLTLNGPLATQTFNYEPSVQDWTVPPSVTTITVTIAGAQGGGAEGGDGASLTGICTVSSGHVLGIVVGQQGTTSSSYASGGGGASWVYDSAGVISNGSNHSGTPNLSGLLVVAAGGGGENYSGTFAEPGAAGGTNLATNATTTSTGFAGAGSYAGGSGGAGGTTALATTGVGGGGAGWIGNGVSGTGTDAGSGGLDWANLFSGGSTGPEGGSGGYGGGGQGGSLGGGGGAGYNGGGGGEVAGGFGLGGGGGGSYYNSTYVTLSGSAGDTHTGNGTVTITYPTPGGTAPYTYSWSPSGGTNLTTTAVSAGTYTITVSGSLGCSATAVATITQPATLSTSATVTANVSCNGLSNGNASATTSGGTIPYTYSWSNGGTSAVSKANPTGTVLSAGTYTVYVTDNNGCTATASATVTQPNGLTLSASVTANVTCNGGTNGNATATPGGGTTPYTYSWSNGSSTVSTANPTGAILSAGTYTVTVRDNNGCNTSVSVTVTQPSAVTVTTTVTANVSCNGLNNGNASATVGGGTGAYTYSWSNGSTTVSTTDPTGAILSAGTYTVTVSDNNGCTGTATATITQPNTLTATASATANVSCNGYSNGNASAAPAGGTSPYTYSWSNGSSTISTVNPTGSILSAATYTVYVSDNNGCTASANVTITQPNTLTVSASATANVSCGGGTNGNASANPAGGTSPYTYSWSNGSTTTVSTSNPTGQILSAGTYTVTVSDNNGCTATAAATITQPYAFSASTSVTANVSCNGYSNGNASAIPAGGTAPFTYSWSNGSTTTVSTSNPTGQILSAGTYTVTVSDNNGCTTTATATISQPSALTATTSVIANVSCNGYSNGNASATPSGGTSPYTYSWSNGSTTVSTANPTGAVLSTGTYTVTVIDNNGCTTTAAATISQSPALTATTSVIANVSCNGYNNGNASATPSGGVSPYTYSWSNGSSTVSTANPTGAVLSAGTYTVTVSDNNGCTATASAVITQPLSPLGISISSVMNGSCTSSTGSATANMATGGTSPYTYSWTPSGGNSLTATGLFAGTYTIIVTDANSCSASASATISQTASTLQVTTSVTDILCFGSSGSATASPSGGTTPYTYSWSNGTSTVSTSNPTGSVLGAGTYTVTVTDNNGCTATAAAVISQPSSLSVGTSVITNVSCNGYSDGNASATPSGGVNPYTYSWSNGTSTVSTSNPTGSVLSAGTYTVYTTDNNGCTATTAATITQPMALGITIASMSNAACNGYDGTITANEATGGTPPYTYTWALSGGTNLIATVSAGTYTITVIDNNSCSASTSAIVTQPSSLSTTATATANVSCNGGNNGNASATPAGGTSPYTYSWSNGSSTTVSTSNPIGAVLSAGTYTVTVTDNNGCTATAAAVISQPSSLSVGTSVITNVSCNGYSDGNASATPSGGVNPYTYSWSNGTSTVSTSNPTGSVLSAGTYTVYTTDNNGCTATTAATITQPMALGITIASVSNAACNGYDGTITANEATGGTPPYTYTWALSGGTNLVATVSAGTYTITVIDNNSCSASTSAIVTQPSSLSTTATATANVSCNGGNNGNASATPAGGTGPYTYSWSNGSSTTVSTSNPTGAVLSAGTYTVTVTDNNGCTTTATTTITQPSAALTATASTTAYTSCNGGNNGNASATPAGGVSPYTYSWSNGSSTTVSTSNPTGSVLSAGTYTVYVTDNNGCTATAAATITQPSALTATTSVTANVLCNGANIGSGYVSVSGGNSPYTYSWSNGATTSSISELVSNKYYITVTDNGGCSILDSMVINQPNLLAVASADATTNVSCNGGTNGVAKVSVDGGVTPYTYSWSPAGGSTYIASNLSAGTYSVVVTDNNGCSASSPVVTVTQPEVLHDSVASITYPSCNVPTGSATIGVKGGTMPYTYTWSPNVSTTATATGLSVRSYVVQVKDNHGCYNDITFSITQPLPLRDSIVTSLTEGILCNGTNSGSAIVGAKYGVPPYTYTWNPNVSSTTTASGLSAGTYTVTVSDNNGCTATASATITQPLSPLGISISSVMNGSCTSSTGSITANTATGGTSPYTYSWTPSGGNSLTATGLFAGTYTIIVTDANSCSASASATISQTASTLQVTTSVTNVLCFGGSGSATASPSGGTTPYTYSWSNGTSTVSTSNPTGSVLSAGTYTVTITDNSGCTATASATVTQPATAVGITISSVTNITCGIGTGSITANEATGGTPSYTYQWSDANSQSTVTATGLSAGTYTITATDNNGCTATASATITQPLSPLSAGTSVTANVLCSGANTGSGYVSVSGGNSPYTYSWSNGATTSSIGGVVSNKYYITVTDNGGCSILDSMVINQPNLLAVASANATTNVSCNGGTNGVAKVSVDGGVTPYTYSWSPAGGSTYIASNLSAGTYSVVVTDNNGCSASSPVVTVTQPAVLHDSVASITYPSCNVPKGSATIGVKGGTMPYTYTWNPNVSTTATATGLSVRSYVVQVKDNHGCYNDITFSITQPLPLRDSIVKALTEGILCKGTNSGSATVGAKYGVPPYTYAWNPNVSTTFTASGLSAGTYTVTVSDNNGCTATASASITQPLTALSVGTSVTANVLCNGANTGSGYVSASGGNSPYTYSWSNGATTTSISGAMSNKYYITVTDHNGCSVLDSMVINQPNALTIASANATTNVSCNGGTNGVAKVSVAGGVTPYTYSWSPAGGNNYIASGLSAGIYMVTVNDHNGCGPISGTITVTQPAALIDNVTVTDPLCNGGTGSAVVGVTGGTSPYSYTWSPSISTAASASGLSVRSYVVQVKDNHGCYNNLVFSITQPPVVRDSIVKALTVGVLCNGASTGSAIVGVRYGTSPYTYSWSPDVGNTAKVTGLSAGTYSVTVVTNSGCTGATVTVTITQTAALSASISSSSCSKGLVTATVGVKGGKTPYSYSWSSGNTTATVSGLSPGTYTIVVTDNNNCSTTITPYISCPGNISPDAPQQANNNADGQCCPGMEDINLYPNPNTGQFTVAGVTRGMIIEVYDYTGRKISSLVADNETMQLNISTQSNGVYLIRIMDKGGNLVSEKKVVKMK